MHIYFNIRKTPLLNKKNKYAGTYNKHAQNYTKYAQNGAFTRGTPCVIDYSQTINRFTSLNAVS